MAVIDADTHVDETEDTWSFLQENELQFKPQNEFPENQDPNRPPARYWRIDGRRSLRFIRNDAQTKTTVETRELMDVDARVRAMDQMGVGFQVLYPTLFLVEVTENPEVMTAIRKTYNRWMADRTGKSGGRLRWVVLPPMHDIERAKEELRFARDHGAAGVLKKGNMEAGHWPADPYFFPLYEEAQKLDMPICFHTGSGTPDYPSVKEFPMSASYRITLPVVHAFSSLLSQGVPGQFPKLRWGFIEATASWVPFVLYHQQRALRKNREQPASVLRLTPDKDIPEDALKQLNMYVSCQVDEDLPYILKYTGEDNLMTGSDYSHNDQAQEMDFVGVLKGRAEQGEISHEAVRKMTQDNPRRFYGI